MTEDTRVGSQLLSVVVRLNRWVTHLSTWSQPLTLAQVRVMSQLDELGTVRVGDLARAERCSQPTMTIQVRRLRELGLIDRLPDPADARAIRVFLTKQGRCALSAARQARAQIVESLIDQLDPEVRERLPDALQVLSALLEAAWQRSSLEKEPPQS